MKKRKPLLRLGFACLLTLWAFTAFSQGTSCSSPIVFQSGDTLKSNNSTTNREVWFKFTAAQQRYRIKVTNTAGYAPMENAGVYIGSCGNQYSLERADSAGGVIEFEVNGLITDSIYSIKVSRADSGTTAKFDVLLTVVSQSTCACLVPDPCDLLCNGSFENYGSCPSVLSQIYKACPWNNANTATSDFYHVQECNANNNSVGVPSNVLGNQSAHTGSGYAGILVYHNDPNSVADWHEYITQPFQSPMIAGHTYTVEFWVSLADVSQYAIHAIGAYISTNSTAQNNFNFLNYSPQIINNSGYLTNKTGWVLISGQYTAIGGEQYITIGNFQSYANIQRQTVSGTKPYAYYYIDDVSIKDNVTLSVTPSNPTICSGQGVTLAVSQNAPGPYSWLPTTGLSSSTGSSVVASPTVTTTYTVTSACGQTATVTVNVNPAPQLTVSSNATICQGNNVQLSASGATTYSWSPSTGLNYSNISNPVASPTVTTTYTVTGTNTIGCQATQTVTVTVNLAPACNITGNITSACSNTGQFSTTSLGGASYAWSVSPSATITSGQGTNTVNIDFTGNTAQSYTVSVVVTNTVTSCQSTCTYFVSACCTPADGEILFNDSSSNYNSIMTGQVGINGLFVVDNNCTFYGLDVKLGYNAKILILPGASLTITDDMTGIPSRLYACDYMWDGIYIDGSTASLTVNDGSSIEDAQNAIVSNNGGVYTIGGTPSTGNVKLNKNYKNIVVNSYSGAHTGTVTATEITCNNSVTPVTYNTTSLLRPPHATERTYVGIEVNSVTNSTALPIGSASNANLQNDFDNMDYGIIATNSNVTVKNNEFMNITSPGFSKKTPNCPKGTAICARGNSSIWTNWRTVTVGGPNTNEPNTIRDGGTGIDAASNLNLTATYNTFSNLSHIGITAARNYLKTVTCDYNTFRDIPLGINGFDLRGSTISMSNNSMNMKNKTNAQGIVVSETFQTPLTRYTISSNTIDTVRNGIVGSTLIGSKMDNNTIRLKHTTNANLYGRGIFVKGGSSPNVRKNNIYGQNRNDWWMEGVRIDLSNTDTVTCNNTDDLGAGQFFSGSQPFTYFAKNSMTDHLWGLLLNGGGFIGQQGVSGNPNDNTWNGAFTLSQTHTHYSHGISSPFNVQTGTSYNPSVNTKFPTSFYTTISFNTVTGSSNLNCALATVGADVNAATNIGIDIAENSITYPAYSDENIWMGQWALYNYIKGNVSLLDDPSIQSFYNEADAGNIGYLYRVLDIMGNMDGQDSTDLDSALTYNSSIDPQNAIETNWQDVNNILITNALNAVDVPTDGQLSELLTIAQKCPLSDGPAVYIARAILATYDTSYVEYEDDCEQPDTTTGSGSRLMAQQPLKQGNIKLYPNPNNGDMVLTYELEEGESGELVIYDLSGKAVKRLMLEQEQAQAQMPVKVELPNGVYLYRVTVNGEVQKSDKLVIVR